MKQCWRRTAMIAAVLLLLTAVGCGALGGEETPVGSATPAPPTPPQGHCGDGVCDEVELADPSLCPQDCEDAQEPSTPTPLPPTPTPKPQAAEPDGKCGDGACDEAEQKNPSLCPQDCPEAQVTVQVTPPEATPPPQPIATKAVPEQETLMSPAGEIALVGDPATVSQEEEDAAGPRQANLALILDASGSMNEDLPGTGQTKLAVAKEVMAELIPQIPSEMNGTLWIYGHRRSGDPKSESCKDIEQVFGLGPVDATAYTDRIRGIEAKGWTPIADSIQQAAENLPPGDFDSIILVSDGEETCGGDPCALAEALKASDSAVSIHVVGYAVDQATQEQLQCIARASGGSYHDATDPEGLLQALEEAMAATVVETILRVEIVGPAGAQVGGNVYLYEPGIDRLVSAYVAWKDNIVPPGTYDLLVDTLPDIFYPDLTLPEGSTTIVRIVLGALSVVTPEGEVVMADYHEAGTGTGLGFWGHEGPVQLVPGTYYVEVNQSVSAPITVEPGETQQLVLGGILVRAPDGESVGADFWDATTNERLGAFGYDGAALFVPGTYIVDVRGSTTAPIALESGQTTTVQLGAIQAEGGFTIWDAGGTRLGYYGDTMFLVPGTYKLETDDGKVFENVAVEAGKVTEVK